MSAQIVIDDGTNPPAIGTAERDSTFIGTVFDLSNFDDTGILGWRWTLVDKPIGSSASLSAADTASVSLTPDVSGGYLIRLETFTDAARTVLDDADEQVIGIAFDGPFDWQVPAAGETSQRGARGWAQPRELAIRDVHAFMNSGFVQVQGAQNEETTVVGSEVVMGGFYFNGGRLGPLGAQLRLVGRLNSATPGAQLELRLYDMGAPGTPIVPVRRATAIITTQNDIAVANLGLTTAAAPGVNLGQIHDAARLYELRLLISGATPGDSAKLHWGGLALT